MKRGRGLLNFFLAVRAVQEKAGKHENDAQPLAADERVAEEEDRGQHGEELAGGCDDGAGQGAKFTAGKNRISLVLLNWTGW